jgi:hypothetical protein
MFIVIITKVMMSIILPYYIGEQCLFCIAPAILMQNHAGLSWTNSSGLTAAAAAARQCQVAYVSRQWRA